MLGKVCISSPFCCVHIVCLQILYIFSCMRELQVSLGTIFLTRLTLGNIMEVIIHFGSFFVSLTSPILCMALPQLGFPFIGSFFKRMEISRIERSARPLNSSAPHPSQRRTSLVSLENVYDSDSEQKKLVDSYRFEISEVERSFMMVMLHIFIYCCVVL